jgi:glycosyltransferase involved in cell wall biosynthesis
MSRNVIIYAGGFKLPDGNASAQRVLVNAKLLRDLGYTVVMVGKHHNPTKEPSDARVTRFEVEGFDCFNIEQPTADRKYPAYARSGDTVLSAIDQIGRDRVFAIMAYNYPLGGLQALLAYARSNGIVPIVDTTEWYGFDGGFTPRNLKRFLQHEYRMRVVQKQVGNLSCGSRFLQNYYRSYNTMVLPNCVDMAAPKWTSPLPSFEKSSRRFVYAGSPGVGMSKEYVHWVVDSFAACKQEGLPFELRIVGLTAENLTKAFPEYKAKIAALGDQVTFLGRVPHQQAINEIRMADFFVFLRPNTRVNQAGCPTKLAEAFGGGVPTITNDSGDVGVYLTNDKHGYLLPNPDRTELIAAIKKAIALPDEQLETMKAACKADNPFRYQLYTKRTQEFLERAAAGVKQS